MLQHHAYLASVKEISQESAAPFITQIDIDEKTYISSDSFGIGDVRSLTEKAYMMPREGSKQLIILSVKSITEEAQQALLKILEEPPVTTVFLFCVPDSLYLLPTLLSRFQKLTSIEPAAESTCEAFELFIKMTVPERLNEVTKRLTAKDLTWVGEMKVGLLDFLKSDSRKISPDKLSLLYWLSEHLLTRGASNKQLLEELAFSI